MQKRKTSTRATGTKRRTTSAKTNKSRTSVKSAVNTRRAPKKTTSRVKAKVNPFESADLVKKNKSSYTVQKIKVGSSGLKVESKNIKANAKTNKLFNEFKNKHVKQTQSTSKTKRG